MQSTVEDTLTPEEVAQKLKISTYTVRRLLKERKIRGMKIAGGRYWRIRSSDLEAYLTSQEAKTSKLSPGMETAILSEPALRKEWLSPKEEEYWAHL